MYEKLLTVYAIMAGVAVVAEIVRWVGFSKSNEVLIFNGRCVSFWTLVVLIIISCNAPNDEVGTDARYITGMVATIASGAIHVFMLVYLFTFDGMDYWEVLFNYGVNKLKFVKAHKNREIARNDILTCKTVLTDLEKGVYVVDGRQKTITLDEFDDFSTAICSQTNKLQDSYYSNCKTKPKEKLKQVANVFLALIPLYIIAACAAVTVYALT